MQRVSVVAPCYNEAQVLPEFYLRIGRVAAGADGYEWEFLFVDDGSTDDTGALLDALADADRRVKVVHLARNQGHQIALTAGMDFASGDCVVTMDMDLQDPPELVPELLEKLRDGWDIVHAQRRSRRGETRFKLWTARAFYGLLRVLAREPLLDDCGDFRAFNRSVLMAARSFRERHRFLRGTFALLGFRQAIVGYDRDARAAGETKFLPRKMLGLALDGLLSFSSAPLRSVLWLAFFLWAVSLTFTARAFIGHFIFRWTVPGWTSLVVLLTFFTGLNLFCLAVIGAYVGRIFEQGQRRPLYWCSATRNIDLAEAAAQNPQSAEMVLSRLMQKEQR